MVSGGSWLFFSFSLFFLVEEAFQEQIIFLLTLYFLHVFSPKKEYDAVDFLLVDKLSLVGLKVKAQLFSQEESSS